MNLPEDFGLSPVRTLAHVGDLARPLRFPSIWKTWQSTVFAGEPHLEPRPAADADPSDPSATHQFKGQRHARIGCLLLAPPEGQARAALVTFHGYDNPPTLAQEVDRWTALARRGVAVLAVRVRGFPGSQVDVGDWTGEPGGWITRGLDVPISEQGIGCEWSFAYAVADAVTACRALRRHAGHVPLFLYGQSFGAAVAVLAASQLADRDPVARLAIGLPTLGDWPWRLAHPFPGGVGAGAQIRRALDSAPARAGEMTDLLRAFDTVLHARRIACPVLCKLAHLDDVVPAPSAAAVFNAFAAEPGRKWRFMTRCGHFDAGIADARRHALFEQAVDDFLTPDVDPADAMRRWDPVIAGGARPEPARAESPDGMLFPGAVPDADRALIDAYAAAGRTLDDLPYTEEFDRLLASLGDAGVTLAPRDVFHRLHNLRKASRLPRLGRAPARAPSVTPEEEKALADLVRGAVGSLGQRDQLPFTHAFDALVQAFNQRTGRSLHPHDVWRLVAKLAK